MVGMDYKAQEYAHLNVCYHIMVKILKSGGGGGGFCMFGCLCIWAAVSSHPFRARDDDDDDASRKSAAHDGGVLAVVDDEQVGHESDQE